MLGWHGEQTEQVDQQQQRQQQQQQQQDWRQQQHLQQQQLKVEQVRQIQVKPLRQSCQNIIFYYCYYSLKKSNELNYKQQKLFDYDVDVIALIFCDV